MDNTSEMTVEQALFEFAAAFADFQKLARSDPDRTGAELIENIESAYNLNRAASVLHREGITRDAGFKPFESNTKSSDESMWVCGECGLLPRLQLNETPPYGCPKCGKMNWIKSEM